MFKDVKEALECLGEEASRVYSGKVDGPWEARPESVDGESAWYEWCDDCNTFHTSWYPFGYEVSLDMVEVVVWNCDTDGNWDVSDSAAVGTPECQRLEEAFGYEAWLENYNRYLEHVAGTGEDPCEEFMLPSPIKTDEVWLVNVAEREGQVCVEHATQQCGGHSEVYERSENLPEHVREYLLLKDGAIDPEYVSCIADLSEGNTDWKQGQLPGQWIARLEIEKVVPAMTDKEQVAALKLRAQAALDR